MSENNVSEVTKTPRPKGRPKKNQATTEKKSVAKKVVKPVKETPAPVKEEAKIVSPVAEEKVVEKPIEPVVVKKVEQPVRQEPVAEKEVFVPKKEIVKLTREQRAYVFRLISDGYRINDIVTRMYYRFNMSTADFKILVQDVHTINDLLRNIGVDV